MKGGRRIWIRPCRSFRSEEGIGIGEKEKKSEENCGEVMENNGFLSRKSANKFVGAVRNAVWSVSKPSLRSEPKFREALEKLEETLFSVSSLF